MFKIRYYESNGLVNLIGDAVPAEGHVIVEVESIPHYGNNQHLYYIDGEFSVVDVGEE